MAAAADLQRTFAALPYPATWVDAAGIVLDVNQAFLRVAAAAGRPIGRCERVGRHVLDFAGAERPDMTAMLDEVLGGKPQVRASVYVAADGRQACWEIRGLPLRDAAGAVCGALLVREDITERFRQQQRDASLHRLRQRLWSMTAPSEFPQLLLALYAELQELCPHVAYCSVYVRSPASDAWTSYQLASDQLRRYSDPRAPAAVQQAWQRQEPCYRADLHQEDPFGEGASLVRAARGYPETPRALLDVPFNQGTLGVSSPRPHAFDPREVRLLAEMAMVLNEGFARLADLQTLEHRSRSLEEEVDGRENTESALRESEKRYRALVEDMPAVLCRFLPDGTLTFVNAPFCALFGTPREELVGRSFRALVAEPAAPPETHAAPPADDGSYTRSYEQAVTVPDGGVRLFQWTERTLHTAGGRPVECHAVGIDITQRQRAEDDLRVEFALQRLRISVLEMRDQSDWDGIVQAFEKELHQLVDFRACSIALFSSATGPCRVYCASPAGRQQYELPVPPRALQQVLAEKQPLYRRSAAMVAEFADVVDVFDFPVCSVVDVPFPGGSVAVNHSAPDAFSQRDIAVLEKFSWIVAEAHRRMQDMAARASVEQQLRHAQKMEAIGRLAGGIAHDFNNLLTVLNGYTQLLLNDAPATGFTRDALEQLDQACAQATALTRQLLGFSRNDVQNLGDVDLNKVVQDLQKMLRRVLGDAIRLESRLDPALSRVRADSAQLQQVILNLAINASDAMPDGGTLTLTTNRLRENGQRTFEGSPVPSGDYVRLLCTDTGVGMDAATLARVFEPFFTTKEAGRGTGLGLATVYGIIRQSGGYIWVDSTPGAGTTFELLLPALPGAARAAAPTDAAAADAPDDGAETLLVVEDDPSVLRTLQRILERQGYTVLAAADGLAALDLAQRHGADIGLLITDVAMPEINGREVAETLRTTRPGLRVMFISGYPEGILDDAALHAPNTAFLQKPVQVGALLHAVRALLDAG